MVEPGPKIRNLEGWQQVLGKRRFAVLLTILLLVVAGPSLLFGFGLSARLFDRVMLLLTLFAILSLCFEPRQRVFALVFGIPTIILSLGGHAIAGRVGASILVVGHLCEVLFFFGAALLIVKSLFNNQAITFDSIFGAVCGYLFLGLGWAVLYSMIESFQPGSFEINRSLFPESDPSGALSQVLTYYSFVTLTTVGYGDITPISSVTLTLSWIEAVTGQFYLAVIVAGLVSLLVSRTEPRVE